jgi:two-component sensor histidine kinase
MNRVKTPILHLVGWAFFVLNVLLTYPPGFVEQFGMGGLLFKTATFYSIMAAGFYTNYLLLTPRFLARRRYVVFFSVLLLIVAGMVASFLLHARFFDWYFGTGDTFFNERVTMAPYLTFEAFFFIAVSTGVRFSTDWFRMQTMREELRQEREAAELAMLRQQLSPHFLFNAMNNIYSLTLDSPADAPRAMLLVADLMRGLLDSIELSSVALTDEIAQLKSYIELKRLQHPDPERIRLEIDGTMDDRRIHPMLLLPLVENAFKHGDLHTDGTAVHIRLTVDADTIDFQVENTPSHGTRENTSGVGLRNIRRRLELLYPGAHSLHIESTPKLYSVTLKARLV